MLFNDVTPLQVDPNGVSVFPSQLWVNRSRLAPFSLLFWGLRCASTPWLLWVNICSARCRDLSGGKRANSQQAALFVLVRSHLLPLKEPMRHINDTFNVYTVTR